MDHDTEGRYCQNSASVRLKKYLFVAVLQHLTCLLMKSEEKKSKIDQSLNFSKCLPVLMCDMYVSVVSPDCVTQLIVVCHKTFCCLQTLECVFEYWMVSSCSRVFILSPLLEPGKHKHRKCERPLSAQLSKPVIVRPGSRRYDVFVCFFCNTA